MFSQSICKICKYFISCKDYRTRKCLIQTNLFSEIIRSSAKNDDIINYCNKEFSAEHLLKKYQNCAAKAKAQLTRHLQKQTTCAGTIKHSFAVYWQ